MRKKTGCCSCSLCLVASNYLTILFNFDCLTALLDLDFIYQKEFIKFKIPPFALDISQQWVVFIKLRFNKELLNDIFLIFFYD